MLQPTTLPLFRPIRWHAGWRLLLLIAILATLGLGMLQDKAPATPSTAPRLATIDGLPTAFIPNRGQAAEAVRFQARDSRGALSFLPGAVTLALPATEEQPPTTVHLRFADANLAAPIRGEASLPGVVNIIRGDDPSRWHQGLPTYAAIRYQELYPGIDLVYNGAAGELKGTYFLAPGADPRVIRWHYPGTRVQVEAATGDLLITLPTRPTPLREEAPVAWQEVGDTQVPVAVAYQVGADGMVAFEVGHYDPALPLVLDPTLRYSTFFGGNSAEWANALVVDAAGNPYMAGYSYSTDLPGATAEPGGANDAFVTKFNPAGSAVLYTTYVGGSELDEVNGLAVDGQGRVWIAGNTFSPDFPLQDPFQAEPGSTWDAFVAQLSPTGALEFSSYLGGENNDSATGIALDRQGNLHLTGYFWEGFVAKVATNRTLAYVRGLAELRLEGTAIAVDQEGHIYLTGEVNNEAFPVVNPIQPTCARYSESECSTDAFIIKLDPAGEDLLFSTYLGGSAINEGSGSDRPNGIAVGPGGAIYLTGQTMADDFPVANAFQPTKAGENNFADAFVTRLVPEGAGYRIAYSTYLGGQYWDAAWGITVDTAGNAYVTGVTGANNFPVRAPLQPTAGLGICGSPERLCYDAFITHVAPNGTVPFSTYLGGGGADDVAHAIAVDREGNIYATGYTRSSAFPTTPNAFQKTRALSDDAFLVKIFSGVTPPPPPTPTPPPLPHKHYIPFIRR